MDFFRRGCDLVRVVEVISVMVKIFFGGKGLKNCHESLDFSCGKGWRFLQGSEKKFRRG